MNKPNIFKLATKELSQDAFFTWLLQWADDKHKSDMVLHETAKDFVRLLIGQNAQYPITSVKAERQWKNIDIKAIINDEYFICIEDKTNTKEHSNQLERYKETVQEYYGNSHKLVFIYLKTGNESALTLKKVKEKGYSIIGRKEVLEILDKRQNTNDIICDFHSYLAEIEKQTNLYHNFEKLTSSHRAGQGFYLKIQEHISEWTDWRHVSNKTGGFLGFWYHWREKKERGKIYIQIENAFKHGIKLVLKITEWDKRVDTLYQMIKEMKPIAKNKGLVLTKPNTYRAGSSSTLAIVQNAFKVDENGNFDIESFFTTLKQLEEVLNEYCNE
ncbi:MAG: PD-(D/E)XK nuclease family protein [Treponemataceae bacterium]